MATHTDFNQLIHSWNAGLVHLYYNRATFSATMAVDNRVIEIGHYSITGLPPAILRPSLNQLRLFFAHTHVTIHPSSNNSFYLHIRQNGSGGMEDMELDIERIPNIPINQSQQLTSAQVRLLNIDDATGKSCLPQFDGSVFFYEKQGGIFNVTRLDAEFLNLQIGERSGPLTLDQIHFLKLDREVIQRKSYQVGFDFVVRDNRPYLERFSVPQSHIFTMPDNHRMQFQLVHNNNGYGILAIFRAPESPRGILPYIDVGQVMNDIYLVHRSGMEWKIVFQAKPTVSRELFDMIQQSKRIEINGNDVHVHINTI